MSLLLVCLEVFLESIAEAARTLHKYTFTRVQ